MSQVLGCFGVVLAAGQSSRFGSSKLLEVVDGAPLVAHATRLASATCGLQTLLVVGYDRQRVRYAAGEQITAFTVNDRYTEGLSTSIGRAVEALEHCADAILLLLADQIAITEDHLHDLLGAFDGRSCIATAYAGSLGPPALFPKAYFATLKTLQGDTGAKQLLLDPEIDVITLPFEPAALDIDTPDDLARLR